VTTAFCSSLFVGALSFYLALSLYIVGGVLLFKYGQYVYFRYYEWDIFGAISMLVAFIALINAFALSNESVIFTRVCSFFWPSALITSSIRAIFMSVELNRGKSKIQWECDHGGYLYGANSDQYVGGVVPHFSTGICRYGVSGLYSAAVVISVIVDLGFQMYMAFLNWRFSKRLLKYTGFVGPDGNGYYNA